MCACTVIVFVARQIIFRFYAFHSFLPILSLIFSQFVTSSPSLQHLSSSSSSQQWPMSPAEVTGPIPFAFPLHATPTPSADAIDKRNYQVRSTPPPPPLPSTEQPQPPTVVVSSTATPLCGTFLGPTCPNVVVR